jgi:hypothetical protein
MTTKQTAYNTISALVQRFEESDSRLVYQLYNLTEEEIKIVEGEG